MNDIDPDLKGFAENFPEFDLRRNALQGVRELIASFTPNPLLPAPEALFIPSITDPQHKVRVLKYAGKKNKPCPALIQFHGGGFVLGAAEDSHYHNNLICSQLGITVFAVDYRLAPEHPFPSAIEDGHSVLQWIISNARELGIDEDKIILSGESAGGGIAASLAHHLGQQSDIKLRALELIYPMLDPRTAQNKNEDDGPKRYIWTAQNNRHAWDMYAPEGLEKLRAALPISSTQLAHFPPTSIYVGTADLFYAECLMLVKSLKHSNVPTQSYIYHGAVHGFPMAIGSKLSQSFWDDYITNIKKSL